MESRKVGRGECSQRQRNANICRERRKKSPKRKLHRVARHKGKKSNREVLVLKTQNAEKTAGDKTKKQKSKTKTTPPKRICLK